MTTTTAGAWRAQAREQITRPSTGQIARAAAFGTATLHEASGQRGALPSAIKPVAAGMAFSGPAVTVLSPPGDNLWLHRAIYVAQPGDVLMIDTGGAFEFGYWGEIMAHAAIARGLAGVVIDGCARDGQLLEELGLPIFSRGLCIRGTGKNREAYGAINHPVRIGDVAVFPGDLIVGDRDGVVAVEFARIDATLEASAAREHKEADIIAKLKAGKSTLELYGFD